MEASPTPAPDTIRPSFSPAAAVAVCSAGGPPLGLFEQAAFEEETLFLNPGDRLVLFSDGVTEARNTAGEEFGDERLIACAAASAAGPPSQMVAAILSRLRDFCGAEPYHDDVTLAVAHRIGSIK